MQMHISNYNSCVRAQGDHRLRPMRIGLLKQCDSDPIPTWLLKECASVIIPPQYC